MGDNIDNEVSARRLERVPHVAVRRGTVRPGDQLTILNLNRTAPR